MLLAACPTGSPEQAPCPGSAIVPAEPDAIEQLGARQRFIKAGQPNCDGSVPRSQHDFDEYLTAHVALEVTGERLAVLGLRAVEEPR